MGAILRVQEQTISQCNRRVGSKSSPWHRSRRAGEATDRLGVVEAMQGNVQSKVEKGGHASLICTTTGRLQEECESAR